MATTPVQLTEAQEAAAREVFEVFDQHGTGTISAAELSDVFDTLGQPLSADEARELVRQNGSSEELALETFLLPFRRRGVGSLPTRRESRWDP